MKEDNGHASVEGCVKIFVVDSSVLLYDPDAILKLAKDATNLVVIPLCVLEELDKHKSDSGETGVGARSAVRLLDSLRDEKRGEPVLGHGVQLAPEKGFIRVERDGFRVQEKWPELEETKDNKILLTAHRLLSEAGRKEVLLISRDLHMRAVADSVEIPSQDYRSQPFSGYSEAKVAGLENATITELCQRGFLPVTSLSESIRMDEIFPNQFIKLLYANGAE